MKRLWLAVLFAQLLSVSCHAPSADAKESAALNDADGLFASSRYDAALAKYEAALAGHGDERSHTRALLGAIECQTAMGQPEAALDRVRAAKPPSDAALRGIWALGLIQAFRHVEHSYGFADETEEGATGSAKLSKAAVTRELEAALQSLWTDRQALARSPLADWKDVLILDGVDFVSYPSLWDFVALELQAYLRQRSDGRGATTTPAATVTTIAPLTFTAARFAGSFAATEPPLVRLGALDEASALLDGGRVDRTVAAERWRVARVLLGADAHLRSSAPAFRAAASARLAEWATTMQTPLGRADAGAHAAGMLDTDDHRVEALALIDRLLPKTPESDVAVRLRQLRAGILQPDLQMTTTTTRHGHEALHVTTRNLSHVELRLYHIDAMREAGHDPWSSTLTSPSLARVATALASEKPVARWSVATGDKGDHLPVARALDLPAQTALGLYLVVVCDDGKFALNSSLMQAGFVNVTDLAIARVNGDEGVRFYAFDADRPELPANVTFHVKSNSEGSSPEQNEQRPSGREAVVEWRNQLPAHTTTDVDALATRGEAVALFEHPLWVGHPDGLPPIVLYVATDRPIYRPGQTLHARATSIERTHDGGFKIDANRTLRLSLRDTSGKEVAHKDVVTGAMGSVAADFALPSQGLLGVFQLQVTAPQVRDASCAQAVRVEEYKRPEFEVTLAAPTTAAHYGQAAKLSGDVKYYFGGAVTDAAVAFTVFRQRWTPWWSWRARRSPKVEIARGQVKTDKSGHFDVSFTASPDPEVTPSDDPDAPEVSDFIVEVETHDTGGRTITAERSLRVGRQALLVQVDSGHGFYFSNERPSLQVKASNLEEQPQATSLSWTLERLGAPAPPSTNDDEPLQARLARYPTADAHVASGQVTTTTTKPTALPLPSLPAGGYRVRLRAGDAKASYAFLVVDAKTRALPLPLTALALPRDAAAQPGEKVELLLGDSAGTGTYHVELWRGRRLVAHRVERGAALRVVTIPVDAALAGGFTARWIGASGLRIIGADATIAVARKDKALTVELVGKPDALEPGQPANWSLHIRDGKGRPVGGEALVTIYDRSLELYARDEQRWADALWAPPDSPSPREQGVQSNGAQQLPGDRDAEERRDKEIAGSYQPPRLPRFAWDVAAEQGDFGNASNLRVGGGGGRQFLSAHRPMPNVIAFDSAHVMLAAERKMAAPASKRASATTPAPAPPPPPPGPATRTNMAETALFAPAVHIGDDGRGAVDFRAPERLSSWRVQVLALGHRVEAGRAEATFVTHKPLMVRVEIPRFFREGDRSQVTAVVHNETAQPLAADVELAVHDDAGGHSALAALGIGEPKRHVDVPAHGLVAVDYAIVAPDNIAHYVVHAGARAGRLADAEERELPLLPSRQRLVQSQVVALRGNDQKTIDFTELSANKDASLRSDSLTVSIDPELALSVLRAIPSLVDNPYECVEQTINRYVPLAIVARVYAQHPELARAIAAAPARSTEHEPWSTPQNDARRLMTMMETPWLADAQGGARDARLQSLLDPTNVERMGQEALAKLTRLQSSTGGFAWFPGGQPNSYMTMYVLEQLGFLQDFGIEPPRTVVTRALDYVAHDLAQRPQSPKLEEASLASLAYGAYVVTSFDLDRYPAAKTLRAAAQAWMERVLANKPLLTPFGRAWSARVMARLGDKATAMQLLESALEGAKRDPLVGVYWAPERYSWRWYSGSIEKHAFFLRTLAELKPNDERVPGMLQWLLFNRKGNEWHSTKASAAAVYSILGLMQKQGALTQPEKFHVVWDKQEELVTVKPTEDRRQPLQWTVRGRDVTPARGKVEVGKSGPGIAFASATWVYSSTKLQAAHGSALLDLQRVYYRRVREADGDHLVPLQSGDRVHVGDDLEVRLTVKSKSQLEFVHVQEPRGAGFEETTLTSGYRWNRVPAYEEPRDTLFNFFLDWLPEGEVELRHSLRPTTPGRYRIGSAVVQSMYSPDVAAFSAGLELEVVR